MAARTLPNLALQAFFAVGEDGWDDEMSLNMLKLSVLTQGGIKSRVAALPGAPVDGDVHILTTDDTIQIRDDGAWVVVVPQEGWLLYDRSTNEYVSYDGATWGVLETGGGGGGVEEAPEDGTAYARKDAAWVPVAAGGGGGLYRFGGFFTATPAASEVLLRHVVTDDFTLPADLDGSVANVGTNPSGPAEFSIQLNGIEFGTMTISAGGVVTFDAPETAVAEGDEISVVAPADSLGAADVAFTFRSTGASGGGGGSSGAAPAIVQAVYSRAKNADAPLVLPDPPTPGNLLLLISSGAGGFPGKPPAGFSLFGYNANENGFTGSWRPGLGNSYQAVWAALRRVVAGDGDTYTPVHGGDVDNYALLEIENADMTFFQVAQPQIDGTNYLAIRQRPAFDGLHLVMVEQDGTGEPSATSDGATVLHTYTSADTFNHCAALIQLEEDAPDVAGVFSAAVSYPVAAFISLSKKG